jgi:hypothetical protein
MQYDFCIAQNGPKFCLYAPPHSDACFAVAYPPFRLPRRPDSRACAAKFSVENLVKVPDEAPESCCARAISVPFLTDGSVQTSDRPHPQAVDHCATARPTKRIWIGSVLRIAMMAAAHKLRYGSAARKAGKVAVFATGRERTEAPRKASFPCRLAARAGALGSRPDSCGQSRPQATTQMAANFPAVRPLSTGWFDFAPPVPSPASRAAFSLRPIGARSCPR